MKRVWYGYSAYFIFSLLFYQHTLTPCRVLTIFIRKLHSQQMTVKDKRMKCLTEVLNGIRVLKLYAWEESFQEKINTLRQDELRVLFKRALLTACAMFIFGFAPFVISIISFATYVMLGNQLDARKAFVSLALFNILRISIALLPMAVGILVQSRVSLNRIANYMAAGELKSEAVTRAAKDTALDSITIDDGKFSWSNDSKTATLGSIQLSVGAGKLVALVGPVASGKSSLCSAVLGLMEKQSGQVIVRGKVAYVAQQAWLQNASVRNNILFAAPFDKGLYAAVLDACALSADLEMLPAGDRTEIGENGINLSGGQKQRIALARALYSQADIYILDDPLAAVDAHVAKHIFERVLSSQSGLLRNRTRLLVTNGVGFLPKCDWIAVMTRGEISESGTYTQLLDDGRAFSDFLNDHAASQTEVEPQESDKVIVTRTLSAMAQRVPSLDIDRSSLRNRISTHGLRMKELNGSTNDVTHFKEKRSAGQLTTVEATERGSTKLRIYALFIKYVTFVALSTTLFFYFAEGVVQVASNFWLVSWSNDIASGDSEADRAQSLHRISGFVYFGVAQAICLLLSACMIEYGILTASRKLHKSMLDGVLKASIS